MLSYLRSRTFGWTILAVVIIDLLLGAFATPAIVITHGNDVSEIPLLVIFQFLPVAFCLYGLGTSGAGIEATSARRIWILRCITALTLSSLMIGLSALESLRIGAPGSLGIFAPVRAEIGLIGVGLLSTMILDRRIAGIVPIVFVLLPVVVFPRPDLGGQFWGFVMFDTNSAASWTVAIALWFMGMVGYTAFFREARLAK
ncbi:hypothetical protein F1C58_03845 [Glaciihabitans sp. INWT7]|uniref:hypothetical protein n=1 Tax=Glaciihabitans sp. INWT7 TaxID=2596912 RepID=UPI00162793B2|nr:hypothetical protein [Glaciihabitans sp. INWT7]QNE46126.1 hypothetical protein F1C58_03845 [Glaciihabitans sp. INWT7]